MLNMQILFSFKQVDVPFKLPYQISFNLSIPAKSSEKKIKLEQHVTTRDDVSAEVHLLTDREHHNSSSPIPAPALSFLAPKTQSWRQSIE